MTYLLKNAKIFENGSFVCRDVLFDGTSVSSFDGCPDGHIILDNCFIFPGFVDVHVHLREPGFSYKETIKTGTKACAHGGYTHVFSMPNLDPVPDSRDSLAAQCEIIDRDAVINVYPYGSITVGQKGEALSDFDGMKDRACAFSDDGRGIQNAEMMQNAMIKAKELGKIIVAHCEDNSLLHGGYIHDGKYAAEHGHRGICSESEWGPIKRDIELAKKTGCPYHVCHISAKESVELIRAAKQDGVDITCETAPHYLVMSDKDLREEGRFKMNPPLRDESDRVALVEGILDGTIDMIATDHAPHSKEEKSRGLEKSAFGIVGIETAFSVMYTKLVKTGVISLEKLIELLSESPRRRFSLPEPDILHDFTVWKLDEEFTVNPDEFLSKGRATPFESEKLYGKCLATVICGRAAYKDNKLFNI